MVSGGVVQLGQLGQGQDVVAGDAQDGQLGQLLAVGVTGHLVTWRHRAEIGWRCMLVLCRGIILLTVGMVVKSLISLRRRLRVNQETA